ncbi:hypothetical protein HDU98_009027 [Podochytrium sp. JEL0797]|nr:hypothetical protein HDU98_009027 [Podochytrium sp. JEL0797]
MSQPGANNDLETQFRTAALAVTQLYQTSRASRAAAFDEGYALCFEEVVGALMSGAVSAQSAQAAGTAGSAGTSVSEGSSEGGTGNVLLDGLVSFYSAKQDVLGASSAEALGGLVALHRQREEAKCASSLFTFTAKDDSTKRPPRRRQQQQQQQQQHFAMDLGAVFSGVDFNFSTLGLGFPAVSAPAPGDAQERPHTPLAPATPALPAIAAPSDPLLLPAISATPAPTLLPADTLREGSLKRRWLHSDTTTATQDCALHELEDPANNLMMEESNKRWRQMDSSMSD